MSFSDEIQFNSTDFDAFGSGSVDKPGTSGINSKRQYSLVHIRNQQRSGRKSITTMIGFASDLDLQKILKCMRKMFSTNGTILHDEEGNQVLQLQGDRRREAADFLIKYKICEPDEVKVHGA